MVWVLISAAMLPMLICYYCSDDDESIWRLTICACTVWAAALRALYVRMQHFECTAVLIAVQQQHHDITWKEAPTWEYTQNAAYEHKRLACLLYIE